MFKNNQQKHKHVENNKKVDKSKKSYKQSLLTEIFFPQTVVDRRFFSKKSC